MNSMPVKYRTLIPCVGDELMHSRILPRYEEEVMSINYATLESTSTKFSFVHEALESFGFRIVRILSSEPNANNLSRLNLYDRIEYLHYYAPSMGAVVVLTLRVYAKDEAEMNYEVNLDAATLFINSVRLNDADDFPHSYHDASTEIFIFPHPDSNLRTLVREIVDQISFMSFGEMLQGIKHVIQNPCFFASYMGLRCIQ